MFKEIYFYCDENGNPLDDANPRILRAEDINSKCFVACSIESHGESGLQIARVYKNPKGDLWNDDGRPATVLFQIRYPSITFLDNMVTVIGFEIPNLVLAGVPSEPYSCEGVDSHPVRNAIRSRPYPDGRSMKGLTPQKIILIS